MNEEIIVSPWPLDVIVSPELTLTVSGISGNSYVVQGIGLVSPTTANEVNVLTELSPLWAAFKLANP